MCGGASKILVRDLDNLSQNIECRLKTLGLVTAQDILDEGRSGLRAAGLDEGDISSLNESLYEKVGQRID